MHMSDELQRVNLSDAAERAIREMIVDGRLGDGERLNEVHLASRLGLSRTPIREALNRLASEGALEMRPRKGYFVLPLTIEEFEQAYDIRPILDPAALRTGGVPGVAQLDRLDKLNRQLATARTAERASSLDDAWHLELLSHCQNRILIGLIEAMMLRTKRYELALMRETKAVVRATDSHKKILAALRRGNLDRACEALRDNLTSGKAVTVSWLKARATKANGDRNT